jgi:hypothetical protein
MQQILLWYSLVPADFHLSFHCQRLLISLRPLHPFVFLNSCEEAKCIPTYSTLFFLALSQSFDQAQRRPNIFMPTCK